MSETNPTDSDRPAHEDPPYIDMVVGPGRTLDNRRFGRLLADLREHAGLSRADAAGTLKVTTEYLRLIELGRRTPAMGQMRAFLDVYKVDGELGKLQPGGDRPDLIVFPPNADEPLTIDFASRIREARRKGLTSLVSESDTDGDGVEQDRPTARRDTALGHIVTLLVGANEATLRKVRDLLEGSTPS